MDATLIGTHKRQARYCCKKHKAYQPPTTYWHVADLVFHSEFREGNVNAGYEQLTTGVSKVMMRSNSAGCQKELLRLCAGDITVDQQQEYGIIFAPLCYREYEPVSGYQAANTRRPLPSEFRLAGRNDDGSRT